MTNSLLQSDGDDKIRPVTGRAARQPPPIYRLVESKKLQDEGLMVPAVIPRNLKERGHPTLDADSF